MWEVELESDISKKGALSSVLLQSPKYIFLIFFKSNAFLVLKFEHCIMLTFQSVSFIQCCYVE